MEAVRAAHADYYCALAERAQPELTGPDQVAWFRRLERELANLRVALTWSQTSALEINTRLAVALGNFWIGHGHMSEGRRWLKEALQDERGLSGEWQAQALMVAGRLAWKQGDFREAQLLLTESRDLFRQMGDRAGLAFALFNLGVTVERQGDYTTGQTYLEESLQLARRVGDTYTAACALGALAEVANWQGDMARDRLYLEEALAAHRARRDPRMTAAALMNLGISNVDTGEFEVGRRHIQASLDVARELDDPQFTADCLLNLGDVLVAQGRPAEARGYLEEAIGIYHATHNAASADAALATLGQALEKLGDLDGARARQASALRLRAEAGDQYHVAVSLTHLARVLWRERLAERAARLLGAADAIRDALGASIRPSMRVEVDQLVAGLQADLGEGAYRQAWEAGRRLSQEEAVAMGTE
jgi:tetratricopeptide (TPR) repeat protein